MDFYFHTVKFILSQISTSSCRHLEPYSIQTYNISKYFITIVDDFTRTTWTHFQNCKSNAFIYLTQYLVETHFTVLFKLLKNALELDLSTNAMNLFLNKGIIHQISCPHTPQQNGVLERNTNTFLRLPEPYFFGQICHTFAGVIVYLPLLISLTYFLQNYFKEFLLLSYYLNLNLLMIILNLLNVCLCFNYQTWNRQIFT